MTTIKSPTYKRLSAPLSVTIATALFGCSQASVGCDFDSAHSFQITSTTINETLLQIGRVSGCAVSFAPERTGGQSAPPITGELTVREAMRQALVRSNLETVQTRNGTLTVRKRKGTAIPLAENK